jgi:hypothetical protein
MPTRRLATFLALLLALSWPVRAEDKPRPLLRDFIGLCGHTIQFKPDLYAPVTRLVRDYHPLQWDFGDDTGYATTFPMARNRVDWSQVYGSWVRAGYRAEASLLFDDIKPEAWKDIPRDAFNYGKAFASAFGPSAKTPLLEAAEIGNEPGKYDDPTYRKLFEAMARGMREGDPKMRIATCAANLGPSGSYSKSVDLFTGLESLYDVVNIHVYAEIEPWPTWRRGPPEDPTTKFVENISHVLKWRAEHAPAKELWLTEFGWDATTKPRPDTGDFAKWEGSTETQQAQWIVRGYLVLSALGVDRAYLYFFNDDDTPHLHGSSGLTRNFVPKPAFHSVAWLQRGLGDYRFARVHREDAADSYIYEFTNGDDSTKRVLAVWKVNAPAHETTLPIGHSKIAKAERMPLSAAAPEALKVNVSASGEATIEAGELPIFVWLEQ